MSTRMTVGLLLAAAAVALGAWRVLLPTADSASNDVSDGASALIGTTTLASLTAARASLDAQRMATGSFAGASVQPPLALVRANESAYCLQLVQGSTVQHLAGPGGTLAPGGC